MGSRFHPLQPLKILQRLHRQDVTRTPRRTMTSNISHMERTAADRREPDMHTVVLDKIEQINREVRCLTLRPLSKKPQARDLTPYSDPLSLDPTSTV